MTTRRTAVRLAAAPAALAVLALSAGPASAHVGITPSDTAAGSYTVLTVSVPHGCDGSPTTRIEIGLPAQVLAVTPTRNPLWTTTEKQEELPEPLTDAHGNSVTERDAVVVYAATEPLPEGVRDAFELSLKLPDTPGETLVFPVVQTCAKGETAWTEVAGEGQDHDDLEHPAPTVEITDAVDSGHGHGATATKHEAKEAGGSQSTDLGAWGLAAGLLGLAAGGFALIQVRRRP